jgi:homogentisate 1,2-dioxygenase
MEIQLKRKEWLFTVRFERHIPCSFPLNCWSRLCLCENFGPDLWIVYAANASMVNEAFCNNDGNMLIIPQQGRLDIQTELGRMMVRPGEICVIQAGLRFRVSLPDGPVHGYINEIFGGHWELPDLGPIGANGLAHPRDFETPFASFDIDDSAWTGKVHSST